MADPQTTNDFPKLGIDTQELCDAIELLIQEAREEAANLGAVNWGDIGVTDIEYRLSMLRPDLGPICVVTLEEASPDCDLALFITHRLDRKKYPKVEVQCEW